MLIVGEEIEFFYFGKVSEEVIMQYSFLLLFFKISSCSSGFEAYTILPDFELFPFNNHVPDFHRSNELFISTKNSTQFLQ